MRTTLIVLIFFILVPSSSIALCPQGYIEIKEYESIEATMRWRGKGEFKRCLNQDYPARNNFRDSWGTNYGYANYKCGNIEVYGYLGGGNYREVKSSNASIGSVKFESPSGLFLNPPEGTSPRNERRQFCKQKGESVTCYDENKTYSFWMNRNYNNILEGITFYRDVSECAEVTF
jgi:hypothetical protein